MTVNSPCFIVNPISGGSTKSHLILEIESFCKDYKIDFDLYYTECKGHAVKTESSSASEKVH